MSRHFPPLGIVIFAAAVLLSGCQPQQPFYFFEDGDLSHYLDVATEIEYPDVEEERLGEVDGAVRPFSLANSDPKEVWDLTLEEAVRYALQNSKVMRSIGGQIQGMPDFLVRGVPAQTIYDPAIVESDPRRGTEAALSAFDTQFSSSVFWEKYDTPRNTSFDFIGTQRDLGTFQAQLRKTAATGGTWSLNHNVFYEQSDSPIRQYPSDWNVNLEAEFRQPLLQGAGVQFNRIANPGAIPGFNNGVMIARINTDIALADFEAAVRDLVSDVEVAYWEVYFAYRFLDAMVTGRDSGLQSWREARVKFPATIGSYDEAQARQQYFAFRSVVEQALTDLYAAESKLRYMIGLAATDGRLIRPVEEPTPAKVLFDWYESHEEALSRSVELRERKWIIKQRELELIAAKNYLLPRLDAVGTYRWLGLGDDLLEPSGGSGDHSLRGSNAYQSMTDGRFQEWQFGLELSLPIGFRKEMAGVVNAQLNLARERARLQETELEVSHQLAWAIRELEAHQVRAQTNFNRLLAARAEVEAAENLKESGMTGWTLSDVLDSQRRLAEAERDYHRTLVDYNKAIAQVHYRKGSLLEYNGVCLQEGPWPGKAYFDAHRRARARDASFYLDYGYTRPKVLSRGAYEQHAGRGSVFIDEEVERFGPVEGMPEEIPLGVPMGGLLEPPEPELSAPEPLTPEPELEPQASGPELGNPHPDGAQLAESVAAPSSAKSAYDLGSLKLEKLAGKPAGEKPTADGWSPAVEPASHQEPVTGTQTGDPEGSDRKRSPVKWSDPKSSVTRHESVANPPAAETDRPAAVWKQVQH